MIEKLISRTDANYIPSVYEIANKLNEVIDELNKLSEFVDSEVIYNAQKSAKKEEKLYLTAEGMRAYDGSKWV